ncbi:MAG: alkaline ceramidase, partial [Martelella sp.]
VTALSGVVELDFQRRETVPVADLAQAWSEECETAEPARRSLLGYWIEWAQTVAHIEPEPLLARVMVLDWGGVLVIALPGEIFAETALFRRALPNVGASAFVVGFAEDNPGYIPQESEYAHGGYEVDEAHRYYGQPMSFAPGSAEALAQCAAALVKRTAENSRSV